MDEDYTLNGPTDAEIEIKIAELRQLGNNEELRMRAIAKWVRDKCNENPWLSPVTDERKWQEGIIKGFYPEYPKTVNWQIMNMLLTAVKELIILNKPFCAEHGCQYARSGNMLTPDVPRKCCHCGKPEVKIKK